MDVRASDAERDTTVNRLSKAAAEGRLTLEELTDRIEAATGAVMRSDLVALTSDLPATAAVGHAVQGANVRALGGTGRAAHRAHRRDALRRRQGAPPAAVGEARAARLRERLGRAGATVSTLSRGSYAGLRH
jgi:hypothetical protein